MAKKTGLGKDRADTVHVFAQGLTANGPLGTTTIVLASVAAYAYGAVPIAYLLGCIVVWFWVNTPIQFSKTLASSSGMAYFSAKGLNNGWGYITAVGYAIYYITFMAGISVFFGLLVEALLPQFGLTAPSWLWLPLAVTILIPVNMIVYKGITISLNYSVIAGLIEVAFLVVAGIIIIIFAGHNNTLAVYNPLQAKGHSISNFGVAFLVATFGMSGGTTTVFLGHEAKLPHKSIRSAVIWSTAAVVIVFLIISYALTVGWGLPNMHSYASSNIGDLLVFKHYFGKVAEVLIAVLLFNSMISEQVACSITVSRCLHACGMMKLWPSRVSHVDDKTKTPHVAILLTAVIGVAFAVVSGLIWGAQVGFVELILMSSIAALVAHAIVDAALINYARKERIVRLFVHVVLPIVSIVTIGIATYYTIWPISFPTFYGPIVGIVPLIAAGVHYILARRKAERREVIDDAFSKLGREHSQELYEREESEVGVPTLAPVSPP